MILFLLYVLVQNFWAQQNLGRTNKLWGALLPKPPLGYKPVTANVQFEPMFVCFRVKISVFFFSPLSVTT